MKVKMIDLLVKIANDTLEDKTRVIIENKLYIYDRYEKKLYAGTDFSKIRNIFTFDLNSDVEILSNTNQEKIMKEDKEIEELDIIVNDEKTGNAYILNEHGTKCFLTKHSKIIASKLNEVIREVNKIKKEGK